MNGPVTQDQDLDVKELLETHAARGRGRHVRLLLLVGALVGVILLAALHWRGRSDGAVRYETREVLRGSLSVTVSATGNLEPTTEVEVGSELSGTVRSVEADYNDRVRKGQVLARLDTSKLEAELRESQAALQAVQAQLADAQATLKETESELARKKRLWAMTDGQAVSRQDLDAAEADLARARAAVSRYQAEVAQKQATIATIESDLAKAVIRSPIDGIVLDRSVEPGQTVAATLEAPVLFTLAQDLTQMELIVDVDEADVGLVREGQRAEFTVDAYPDRRFPASIAQVRFGANEEDGVVTYETVLIVNNSDLSLRPGMTATAEILVKEVQDALLVPNQALRFTPETTAGHEDESSGSLISRLIPRPPRPTSKKKPAVPSDGREAAVWVLEDGRLRRIPVTPGETDGTRTVIQEGELEPGMLVVVDAVRVGG